MPVNVMGTCGNCGGRVVSPMHSVKPEPRCEDCGAEPVEKFGRVIPMKETTKPKTVWNGQELLNEGMR